MRIHHTKAAAAIVISFSFLSMLITGCSKENDELQQPLEETSLTGTWRVEAFRYGQDSSNANAWNAVDYSRHTEVRELYCVNDSRVNQSFISTLRCAYDVTANSSVGVVSADCAQGVFMKDTVWFNQTKYDLTLDNNGDCNWVEEYEGSKHVNTIDQPCNSVRYNPQAKQQLGVAGKWTLNKSAKTLYLDYSPRWSRMGSGHADEFKVTGFNGSTLTIKLIGNSGNELRLKKI